MHLWNAFRTDCYFQHIVFCCQFYELQACIFHLFQMSNLKVPWRIVSHLVWTAEEFGSPVLCADVKNRNFLLGNTVAALVLSGWIETSCFY